MRLSNYDGPEHYEVTNDAACRLCGARITWVLTPIRKKGEKKGTRGKMPLDSASFREALSKVYGQAPVIANLTICRAAGRDLVLPFNHFTTCPKAPQRRRP